ncbi:Histidine kinase-, DNA gyrase B-, and HSP90-like ATPase [compost metagenome]
MIEIMDNGVGMSAVPAQIRDRKKHRLSGIGVSNVHSRIRLLFGSRYGIRIQSEEGYGTAVMITVPAIVQTDAAEERAAETG